MAVRRRRHDRKRVGVGERLVRRHVLRRGPAANPTGPDSGAYRVLRGGSWFEDDPSELRASFRYGTNPSYSLINDGFRCARGE
ncbi:MAG: SUMF1/EgtB/PvdO family nonheme iron enzyme [Deltaproteobacteria bacterium]|nr:SUMF1/EgtB/PvdO family nonheme iron enzyme [Deltaproteobacteria bacterium]